MIRTPLTWLVGALAATVLAAGCGSSSSTSSSTASSAPAAATTPAPASTPATTTTPTATTGALSGASAAGVAQAVAVCRSVLQRAPGLPSSTKAKVESICTKAEHGDLAGARAAAVEVCTEVINASAIPSADKQSALNACKASAG